MLLKALRVTLFWALWGWAGSAAAAKLPKVVVLGLKPIDDASRELASNLTEVLTTDLAKAGLYDVVSESEIGSLIGLEQRRQLLGCTDDGCLSEIGGALGGDLALLGTVGRLGSQLRVDLKIVDLKRMRILARDGALARSVDELLASGRAALRSMVRSPSKGPAAGARPEVQARADRGSAPYVFLGTGAAALVGGGVLVGLTVAHKRELTYQQADVRASAGFILAGAGLAAAATGVVWAVLGKSSAGARTPELSVAPLASGVAMGAAVHF